MLACKIVLTRSYSIPKSSYLKKVGKKNTADEKSTAGIGIILGGDYFNHKPKPKIKGFRGKTGVSVEEREVVIKADRNVEAGEEVFLSYGEKRNIELFANYGFVLSDNPDEQNIVAVLGTEKGCKFYDDEQLFCIFFIKKFEVSLEILSYLFYQIEGVERNFKSVEEALGSQSRKDRVLDVLLMYRYSVDRFGIDRCIRGARESRRVMGGVSSVIDTINSLCIESHLLFINHVKLIDQLIVRYLISS